MKNLKTLLFIILSLIIVSQASFTAYTPKKDAAPLLDSNGNIAPPGSIINTKTGRAYTPEELQRSAEAAKEERLRLQREAEERARQEAERRRQAEAARPRCSGYDPNDHRDIILAHGGACPPGYKCNYVDNTNHNLFNCKLAVAPGTPIYADNTELCRWDTGCGNL